MPVYWFESKDGELLELSLPISDSRQRVRQNGKTYRRILAPVAIHAYTPVGNEAEVLERRHYRENKAVAEGIANGTMREADDRGIAGDKQPRSSVSQLNGMVADARQKAGKAQKAVY